MIRILPGFSPKAPTPPALPPPPPPPPPPPEREDPSIAEAKKAQQISDKRRKGRSATNLTGNQSQLGNSGVARPEARTGSQLG